MPTQHGDLGIPESYMALEKRIKHNVRRLYRKDFAEANSQEIFQALSLVVKDVVIDDWLKTQRAIHDQKPKIVYYMSMEFLMGRALGNILLNLCRYDNVKKALDEMGIDINAIEDEEPDPGSGTSCRLLFGFAFDLGLCGVWLRHPLPLRHVQAEDYERFSERSAGRLAAARLSV